ncbi:major head protein [uncultured Mediterranean phage]|nr:major head protein [uncultured Mediterranean phage]
MPIATSYDITSVQGAREDLSDQLKRVSPETCPVFSTLKQSRAPKALLTEWMVDSLGEPEFGTPPIDGADLAFATGFKDRISSRVRMGNRIQQVQRPFAVSRLADKIDVAGPQSNLYGASAAKSLILLKTDIESAICSSQLPQTGTDAVGDKLGGLKHWTDPTATTGVFDTSAKQDFRSVTGSRFNLQSAGSMGESDLRDLVQAVYEAGGKSVGYTLYAGPAVVNQVTSYSRAVEAVTATGAAFNVDSGDATLRLSVTTWISDYGRISIVPTLFAGRSSGVAINADVRNSGLLIPNDNTVSLKTLDGVGSIELPDVGGGGRRGFAEWCGTVCVLNARALGSII